MIDVWLIFNLALPFMLILLHTYMEFQRNQEDAKKAEEDEKHKHHRRHRHHSSTENKENESKGWKELEENMKPENQNHVNWKYRTARNLAFIGIPLFSIIFVVV